MDVGDLSGSSSGGAIGSSGVEGDSGAGGVKVEVRPGSGHGCRRL